MKIDLLNTNEALELPKLALYIHIPWCIKKCPYCDFNSHLSARELPEQAYTEALIEDLRQDLFWVQGRKISSIFFGGGTPSLFSSDAISLVLETANKLVEFEDNIEITLEANPGAIDEERFDGYSRSGVNRLSIGVQSFNDKNLKRLGRIHSGDRARRAIESAHKANFNRVNIDLMHGLEQQNIEDSLEDLKLAIDSRAEHISWYQLTVEPNTFFYSNPPALPSEDKISDIQRAGREILLECGYKQYEVSAFAKPGREARHNVNYWKFGDYIGIGAGAHGKITVLDNQNIVRTQKIRHPDRYLKSKLTGVQHQKPVPTQELPMEFMMNVLRLKHGVPTELFSKRTGLHIDSILPLLQKLREEGLLVNENNKIAASVLGYKFLNHIIQKFC